MRRYLILARQQYVEALSYQGMLDVDAAQDPTGLVTERFGSNWLELVLAPESAVYWVLGPRADVEATT